MLAATGALVAESPGRPDAAAELRSAGAKRAPAGAFEKGCLSAHNKWRKLHQAKPIKFDAKVSHSARQKPISSEILFATS